MGIGIELGCQIYNPGTGGVPLGNFWGNLENLDSYEHTIGARFGFESMRANKGADIDEALEWLANGLMRAIVVYSPDAEVIWEGYCHTIDADLGQERRSVSLDGMANRVTVRYIDSHGVQSTTAQASNAASQSLYGVKDAVVGLGTIASAAATNARDVYLATHQNPVARFGSSVISGGMGSIRLALTFAGWYDTLKWVLTSRTSTTSTSTTTQVGDLINTAGVGIGVTNPFLSALTTKITASGISDTEFIAPNTPYLSKIETLLSQGNSGGARLAWGVYANRVFVVNQWAGASPSTITYHRLLGDAALYDSNAGRVAPWNVRPDTMYQTDELLDLAPVATAQDSAARFYVERVTFSASSGNIGVKLEPSNDDSISALLARLGG